MVAAGMPTEQIIDLYKNTPNFDRKVTSYQVTRLAGKQGGTKYSSSSCSKMQEYNLRLPECPCNTGRIKHPMQHYQRLALKEMKQGKTAAPSPSTAKQP
jgi:DNA primase large subunit